jgi:hypothetical protein
MIWPPLHLEVHDAAAKAHFWDYAEQTWTQRLHELCIDSIDCMSVTQWDTRYHPTAAG